MARAAAGILIAAATLLFVVASFFGTADQGSIVRYEFTRGKWPVFTVTAVTPAGRRAGLRPGDVMDYRLLTPLERYKFNLWDLGPISLLQGVGQGGALGLVRSGESFTVPFLRNGKRLDILRRTEGVPWNDRIAAILTDILSGFCAIFGALLLIRGRDRASLLGGLFLVALSIAGLPFIYGFDGFFAFDSFALPSEVIQLVAEIPAALLLYLFAESLLSEQTPTATRWTFRVLYAPGVLSTLLTTYFAIRYLVVGNVNSSPILFLLPTAACYIVQLLAVLALVWYASIQRHQRQRVSIRLIFWSMLAALSGPLLNAAIMGFLGWSYPLDGALGLTVLVMPVGLAYVVFTKNLYDVDFFISRAALYTVLIGIVVAAFALTESLLENAALGRWGNIVVAFAVPVLLGLSMRWIGDRVERALQATLYRDKALALERLRGMVEDFPEAHDPDVLATQVVAEINRTFKSPCALYRDNGTLYSPCAEMGFDGNLQPVPQDDPALMRLRRSRTTVDLREFETALPTDGLLFPLTVVGRVYGAIFVGARPHEQWYDPDDQSVLQAVASELAAALLWLKDRALTLPPAETLPSSL